MQGQVAAPEPSLRADGSMLPGLVPILSGLAGGTSPFKRRSAMLVRLRFGETPPKTD